MSAFTRWFFAMREKREDGATPRVMLASRLISLYRIDREWTENYLLPLFDWSRSHNRAKESWIGFLRFARLYRTLFAAPAFKSQFLKTVQHYNELGKYGGQYAIILTRTALELSETYTILELQKTINALPTEGVEEVAQALVMALESAGQQENYWTNRIMPFWKNCGLNRAII
ncbi:hypothetical protein OH491_19640 [Termitidicoccus mucosus]|uniref:hypothetical protein n=1 Tax=Termitidicoccus mucosus TaxID=1184151 RepID=UPI00318313FF